MIVVTRTLLVLGWMLVTAFPIRYVLMTGRAWRRSFEGWYMVLSKTVFSLVLLLTIMSTFVPGFRLWAQRHGVGVVVYALLDAVFLALNIMLSRAKRTRERRT